MPTFHLPRRATAPLLLLTAACGSSFVTAPAGDGGPDSGIGTDGAARDGGGGVDAASCPAGSLCVHVAVATGSSPDVPGYDATSGAGSLMLDGQGTVVVSVYTSDPGAAGFSSPPAYEFHYPPGGKTEIAIKDLPVTVEGKLGPGTYWYAAAFEDNPAVRVTGIGGRLIGDYISVPALDSSDKASYPKVTLAPGAVAGTDVDISVKPVRVLNLTASASPELLVQASMNPAIHGDGPAVLVLYTGSIGQPSAVYLDVAEECLTLPLHLNMSTNATFPTTYVGTANVFGEILDYGTGGSTGTGLPPGTIYTSASKPQSVNVEAGTWSSGGTITFDAVTPPPGGSDTCQCPLSGACK